jgi:hypothetical protein
METDQELCRFNHVVNVEVMGINRGITASQRVIGGVIPEPVCVPATQGGESRIETPRSDSDTAHDNVRWERSR